MSTPPPPESNQKSCLERAFIFVIRLIFVLVFGIAIGVGIYYGTTLLYGEYISIQQDYQDQAHRITVLETAQADASQANTDRLSDWQTRLETLEIQGDTQKESIADLDSQIETALEYLSVQATAVSGFQATQTGIQDAILALQTEVEILQTDLDALQTGITDFQEDITALENASDDLADTLDENQATAESLNELVLASEARMLTLQYEMVLLQAMELCTRTRLNLVQGNTSLAQSDIEAARDLLATISAEMPAVQADYVREIIAILDDTLNFLPDAPLTEADKLENAWQMLIVGLPEPTEQAETETDDTTETSEPETGVDSTPTPTPIMIITPTPYP